MNQSFRYGFAALWESRVKAGVLQLTLGISLVIAIICASMIMLAYLSRMTYVHQRIADKLRDNAYSGIEYGKAVRNSLGFNEPTSVDLFGEETDSVVVIRKPWGVFEIIAASAHQNKHHYNRSALITAQPDDIGKSIIYSPENNAPIYLAGRTVLDGDVFVSARKFTTGFINNTGFEGTKLFQGNSRVSMQDIPGIDTVLLSSISAVVHGYQDTYSINKLDFFPIGRRLGFGVVESNLYYSNQSIELSDSLAGNLMVQSAIKIRITADAHLDDLIVIAPHIEIDNGFKGSIQCIATNSIIVGKDSRLRYPSALVLLHHGQDSLVSIGERAIVEGIVVLPGFDQSVSGKGRFQIRKGGVLHGMAYINGAADIQGSIWGHITARVFSATSGDAQYPGHIYNAEISSKKRSPYMSGSLLWANTKEIIVAKWLD